MPVNTAHREYSAAVGLWARCRDVTAGSDAVKGKGPVYLPKVSHKQAQDRYDAYLSRAILYPAAARTVEGLTGAVFAKPPAATVPDAIADDMVDVTMTGVDLTTFSAQVMADVIRLGRCGVLVDFADGAGRPYLAYYAPETIVNWRASLINGVRTLTLVVLREEVEEDGADVFTQETKARYRVLGLGNSVGAYAYVSEVWEYAKDQKAWAIVSSAVPLRRGEPLTMIPFQFFAPDHLGATVSKPPILDLVDTNLSHYRTSADMEQLCHYLGLAQPWVAGVQDTEKPVSIGAGTIWRFTNADAKVGILSMGADGAEPLRKRLEDKERYMAVLGARLLEGQASHGEAAETVRLRHAGQSVTLRTMANRVSAGLSSCLQWMAWWAGVDKPDKDVGITLSQDVYAVRATAQEVAAGMQLWQSAAWSFDDLWAFLQRGDWSSPTKTAEVARQMIAADTPLGSV